MRSKTVRRAGVGVMLAVLIGLPLAPPVSAGASSDLPPRNHSRDEDIDVVAFRDGGLVITCDRNLTLTFHAVHVRQDRDPVSVQASAEYPDNPVRSLECGPEIAPEPLRIPDPMILLPGRADVTIRGSIRDEEGFYEFNGVVPVEELVDMGPTLRPLPPQVTVDPVTARSEDGGQVVTGTVQCDEPQQFSFTGHVWQRERATWLDARASWSIACEGETPFELPISVSQAQLLAGPAVLDVRWQSGVPERGRFTVPIELSGPTERPRLWPAPAPEPTGTVYARRTWRGVKVVVVIPACESGRPLLTTGTVQPTSMIEWRGRSIDPDVAVRFVEGPMKRCTGETMFEVFHIRTRHWDDVEAVDVILRPSQPASYGWQSTSTIVARVPIR